MIVFLDFFHMIYIFLLFAFVVKLFCFFPILRAILLWWYSYVWCDAGPCAGHKYIFLRFSSIIDVCLIVFFFVYYYLFDATQCIWDRFTEIWLRLPWVNEWSPVCDFETFTETETIDWKSILLFIDSNRLIEKRYIKHFNSI